MKHTLLVVFALAAGCASTSAPPREPSPGPEPQAAPAPSPSTNDVASKSASSAECARLCKAYEHYRRGALLECEETNTCGARRTNAETANYGRELCDTVVSQCGSSCEIAYKDHRSAKTK